MGKEEIKKLLNDSKKALQQEHDSFVHKIKDDLFNFKKKTLDQI